MNDKFNLDVFVKIGLLERVKNLREIYNSSSGYESVRLESIETICKDLNPHFKYNKKESFFGLKEKSEGFEFILNFCFQYGVVETIIFAKVIDTGQKYGSVLAEILQMFKKNGLLENDFDVKYPLFQNEAQLIEITKIYFSIYEDFKSWLIDNNKRLGN